MKDNKRVLPLPEVAIAMRGDTEEGRWTVEAGSSQRGQAFTDFGGKRMVAPVLDDETARVIRNHELTHARISPANNGEFEALTARGYSDRIVHCAEEFRVNQVLSGLGYDIDLLSDGSEGKSGERLGKEGSVEAWNEAVAFSIALLGTKAYTRFLNGIKKEQPEWAKELRTLGKEIKKVTANVPPQYLGDTTPEAYGKDDEGNVLTAPAGFLKYTDYIAKQAQQQLRVRSEEAEAEIAKAIESGEARAVAKTKGEEYKVGYGKEAFAPLILLPTELTVGVQGYIKPKKRPAQFGKSVRYPDRHLSDPYRRVFGHKRKVKGGIVVIDQSGSMDISEADLLAVLKEVPGALVIGYSHKPRSSGIPNAWVLAKNGKRVREIPEGNIGNGVDGPVLDYAISLRKGKEPIVWVCDGQVTAANDKSYDELNKAVANIVVRHGIIQVRNLDEAPKALASPDRYRGQYYGRAGREALNLRSRRSAV